MIDFSAIDAVGVLGLLGVGAFLVSAITQLTKGIAFFKKIPTVIEVVALSVVLCVVGYIGYCSYYAIELHWYMIFASVIAGFIVANISMFGWENIHNLWNRFKTKK